MFKITFMAEHSNIDIYILKKGHLYTNITEKSSEDLIDSPGISNLITHFIIFVTHEHTGCGA